MPQIHSTDNYTIPGGIKLFFNDGTGERDLGNMVKVSIGRNTTDLDHYTNRPGTRVKDKIITLEESITIEFGLDEPVIENFIMFFKGDALVSQDAGTTAVVEQHVTLGVSYSYASVGQRAISVVTVRKFLDYCYMFDGTATYVDNSVEMDLTAGTPFEANVDAGDFLYIGKATPFKQFHIDVSTGSVGYTGTKWEYWNGTAWATLSTSGTADFSVDATVTFTVPAWALKVVNGSSAYWLRFSQTAASPATPALINSIGIEAMAENTDFTLDLGSSSQDGRIKGISGGHLADGEAVAVSYLYATYTSQVSNLVQVGSIEGSARLEVHPQTGRGLSFDIEIPKCQIKSKGNLSLDDKAFLEIPLELSILDDTENTPTFPYGRIIVYDVT